MTLAFANSTYLRNAEGMWEVAPAAANRKPPTQVVEDLALCLLQVY